MRTKIKFRNHAGDHIAFIEQGSTVGQLKANRGFFEDYASSIDGAAIKVNGEYADESYVIQEDDVISLAVSKSAKGV